MSKLLRHNNIKISTYESRYFKRYDKVKWGLKDENKDKRGLKDEQMMKWWNDDAQLNIDN